MLIKKTPDILSSEITDSRLYFGRRRFMREAATLALAASLPTRLLADKPTWLNNISPSDFSTSEQPNSYSDITTYNNYYEFGTGKDQPQHQARNFNPWPWQLKISGEAEKTGTYNLEDILAGRAMEERIYRLRCVEAWSMVIPWVGFPLGELLKEFLPTSRAKFVEFVTLNDPSRMPGQKTRVLQWPYREGLRIDEAMHPLTILATGLYGEELPNQNGAPLRLVIPWKYGFKSIKAITEIRFRETAPNNSWRQSQPGEYGFYANVNPEVDHPRWSQARERRIGAGIFAPKQETLMFNGYADQVASLYAGMDLKRNF
ncbi:MAG: protein-methionine-sulfoxide reductase catalytic subunit MsrP [Chromatiales bacterium]|nr:protein-methionine-sulfoxide reductase catalytic subunit MsrP [Chromatiales bacterium]